MLHFFDRPRKISQSRKLAIFPYEILCESAIFSIKSEIWENFEINENRKSHGIQQDPKILRGSENVSEIPRFEPVVGEKTGPDVRLLGFRRFDTRNRPSVNGGCHPKSDIRRSFSFAEVDLRKS